MNRREAEELFDRTEQVRVLVCGGRDFRDWPLLKRVLGEFHEKWPIDLLIHGDAPGADSWASAWAINHGVLEAKFRIENTTWNRMGKKAGPIRNRMMLELNPCAVLAFPTGGPGTRDMMAAARQWGVRVECHETRSAPVGADE